MLAIPNPVLRQINESGGYTSPSGKRVDSIESGGVAWYLAEALYRTVCSYKPKRVLEIGMASGISTLSILTALAGNGEGGTLTSIDPFQSEYSDSAGIHHVKSAGFEQSHRLLEEFDYVAMPKLLAAREEFQLVYIDGNHAFENVVLDYFFADLMLPQGGLIGFNDCGWRTVHAAMRYVPPTDRFKEIDVGLAKDFKGRNSVASLVRRLTGRSSSDRYFQKI